MKNTMLNKIRLPLTEKFSYILRPLISAQSVAPHHYSEN